MSSEDETISLAKQSIRTILSNSINEENMGFWQIIYALSDGPKSWSELRERTEISKVTLSRKIKELQELGIVKRTVIPAFPPRTNYAISRALDSQTAEYFREGVRAIKVAQDWTDTMLKVGLKEEVSTQELLDSLLHNLELAVLTTLKNYVEFPIGNPSILFNIWHTTFWTAYIMQCFWGTCEALTISDKRRKEAVKLLSMIIKERKESTPSRKEREIVYRVLEPFESGNNPTSPCLKTPQRE